MSRSMRVRSAGGLRDYANIGYGSGLPGAFRQPAPNMTEEGAVGAQPSERQVLYVQELPFSAGEFVAYAVGTTPLRVDQPLRRDRRAVGVKNSSAAATIWIGSNNGVAINNGWPLAPGESVQFPIDENIPVWVVSTAPGTVVGIVQFA